MKANKGRWAWTVDAVIVAAVAYSMVLLVILLRKGGWSAPNAMFLFPIAAFAIALLAALRLPFARKANLALVLTSSFVSLSSLDLLIAMRGRNDEVRLRTSVDHRTWGDIVPDLRDRDTLAYLNILWAAKKQSITWGDREVLPLSPGVGQVITVLCNESGEYIRYLSDKYGFRNPSAVWESPVRVLMVGDSYAHGACVTAEHTLAEHLRTRWPGTLNLGVGGAGPLWELAVLREYGATFTPDVVLWIYYEGNDLRDLLSEYAVPALRRYLISGYQQHLQTQQPLLDSGLAALHDSVVMTPDYFETRVLGLSWSRILRGTLTFSHLRNRLAIGVTAPLAPKAYEQLEEVLREAHSSVLGWGGKLYFVYLPAYPRYTSLVGSGEEGRKEVLDVVRRLELPLIDLHPHFQRHENPLSLWWNARSHYSHEGFALVAEAVIERLLKDAAVPMGIGPPGDPAKQSQP